MRSLDTFGEITLRFSDVYEFCCDWSFEFLLPPCRPDMVLPDEGTLG